MDEDKQKEGEWKRESERLRVEIIQRFHKLRMEGIIPTEHHLDHWLRRLKESLIDYLELRGAKKTGEYLHGPRKKA
jgi:hypothetical protein